MMVQMVQMVRKARKAQNGFGFGFDKSPLMESSLGWFHLYVRVTFGTTLAYLSICR